MKTCPQCNRTYTDDALSFCLDDGSPLLSTSAPSSFDPGATVQLPQARDTTPPATIAYPGQAPPPPVLPPSQPAWSPLPPTQPQKRSVWPWLLGIGAVLVLMGIGAVILIVMLGVVTNDNNRNTNTNRNSNTNANRDARNANTNNSNSNSRSNLTSFNDDFSKKTWGVSDSTFGKIWYEDEEYHVHGNKGGYIVMYAPEQKEYKDENATVRIGLRSIDGNAPDAGFGLIVHGVKKNNQLEDYGFLIYNGSSPKYAVVLHRAGKESKVVDWTSSSAIRTGTAPNQIEVRIRDLKMDFYINGQFITSVTDEASYRDGRVGVYSSDTGEVAFDDLEISK